MVGKAIPIQALLFSRLSNNHRQSGFELGQLAVGDSSSQSQVIRHRSRQDPREISGRQGLQGTVLAVNQAWNFVVLSLGDRQGVVPNAELLVQRGSQLLGKVRVTSVEPSTSIADILVRTVPRGLSVMPGDTVIYQAQRD